MKNSLIKQYRRCTVYGVRLAPRDALEKINPLGNQDYHAEAISATSSELAESLARFGPPGSAEGSPTPTL